nr:putative germin-like protein 2-1 [Ipomoea batatas]
MALKLLIVAIAILALASSFAQASDPSPLQDFCVAVNDSKAAGLIHFQFNIGHSKAIAFAGLSSQNPGVITIANAVFGSDPPISPNVLTKAFQVDKNVINYLQSQFWYNNN